MGRERITAEAVDAWVCVCGNTSSTSGFFPYADGREVEPTAEAWDGVHYVCAECLRVIDAGTLAVVARPEVVVFRG